MVSHELRTPLTAIRGSLGLIAGGALGPLAPAASRMVDIALVSSDRLTRLINEILDIERIESGVLPMELAAHPARVLVDAGGQPGCSCSPRRPRSPVVVAPGRRRGLRRRRPRRPDPAQPARQRRSSSPNRATSSGCGRTARGAFVEFCVPDQGRGIPEDKLDAIFARFQQVDSSDARDKGGSGLGLAISRSIVEKLGGRIWAANNPTGGATFRFTLPVPADQEAFEPVTTAVDVDRGRRRGSSRTR